MKDTLFPSVDLDLVRQETLVPGWFLLWDYDCMLESVARWS